MHSDSYFCVGTTHSVCQDYALSGVTAKGRAFAIVSDGCSGSPNTDFGSRFMTKATQWALDNTEVDEGLFIVVDAMAQQMASSCTMDSQCLDATVLCAVEVDGGVLAMAAGDGVIVARHRGRSYYDVHTVEFYHGYPAYPSYMGDPVGRMRQFVEMTEGGLASINILNGEDDTTQTIRHKFYTTEPGSNWYHPYTVFFDKEKYDLVMLLSDGVQSFQVEESTDTSKRMIPVALSRILNELTDFKNMKGEFVVRRAKKFLTKTCGENRWTHFDDLSVAVVALD